MGKPNFTEKFKHHAVRQITDRGYPVWEVSQRLGGSQHSLHEWKRRSTYRTARPTRSGG